MKLFQIIIYLTICGFAYTQTWVLEKELRLKDSTYFWTSDEWSQLYQWKDNTVWLQNSQSQQSFQETYKILSDISSVQPISGLRALIHSESQQMIGVVDNTLQLKEGLLAFFDFEFSSISHVAVSQRPDFIWLFDQYRERLILFNINTTQAIQIVDNCFGGLDEIQISQFFEFQQNLICVLSNGSFYEFDRNLTLKNKQQLATNTPVFGFENKLWIIQGKSIRKLNGDQPTNPVVLPLEEYQQLKVLQDRFYFQIGQKIMVFRLKM